MTQNISPLTLSILQSWHGTKLATRFPDSDVARAERVAGYVEKHYHTPLSPSGTAEMRHAASQELPPWPSSEWIEKKADWTFWESERSISEWSALTFKPMVDARDARIAELERECAETRDGTGRHDAFRVKAVQLRDARARIASLERTLQKARRTICEWVDNDNAKETLAALDAELAKGETGSNDRADDMGSNTTCNQRPETVTRHDGHESREHASVRGSTPVSPALAVDDNDGRPCVVPNSDEARKRQVERAARTAKPSRDEAYAALYRVLIDTANIHPTSRAYMLVDAVLALQPNAPVDRSGEHPADSHAAATCGGSVADSPLVGAASVSGPIRKVEAGGDSTSPSVSATALLKHGAPGGAVGVASQESADRVVRSGPPVPTTPPRAEEWPTRDALNDAINRVSEEWYKAFDGAGGQGAFNPRLIDAILALFAPHKASLDEARAEIERLRAENAALKLAPALRPVVFWFAQQMEAQLQANDHKHGWKGDTLESLHDRVRQETTELRFELNRSPRDGRRIVREAADVANMSMMVADNAAELFAPASQPAPAAPPQPVTGEKWSEEHRKAADDVGEMGFALWKLDDPQVFDRVKWRTAQGELCSAIAKVAPIFCKPTDELAWEYWRDRARKAEAAPRAATPTLISEEALEKMCKTYWERDGLQIKWEMLNESTREYQRKDMRAALASLGIEVGGEKETERR